MIQRYSIEDCWKYSSSPFETSNFTLPNSFYMSFKMKRIGNSDGALHLWKTASTTITLGTIDSGYCQIAQYNGGWVNKQTICSINDNQTVELTCNYQNGVFSVTDGTTTKTQSVTLPNPLHKLEMLNSGSIEFSEFKIKPL